MKKEPFPLRILLRDAIILIAIIGMLLGVRYYRAFFWGNLKIDPEIVNLGNLNSGEERLVTFQLVNNTKKTIKIHGQVASCSCVSLNKTPSQIAPGEKVEITANVAVFENYPYCKYKQYVKYLVEEPGGLVDRSVFFIGTVSDAKGAPSSSSSDGAENENEPDASAQGVFDAQTSSP